MTIAQPFALCRTEVTFAQWDACVADGGCDHQPDDSGWGRGDRPVIDVSWDDAQQYLRWLSEKTGRAYRLPSEAEWEYAARAGTTAGYAFGDDLTTKQANFDSSVDKTTDAGSYPENDFGLFDMHGNVWEWVEDRYHESYDGALGDASPWLSGVGSSRVLRGGSWYSGAQGLRSARRIRVAPDVRDSVTGFRCARVQEPASR